MEFTCTRSDELYHHGILGQKWGVRRFQNEDGSYTSAGKRRYALDRDVNDKSRLNIAKIRTGEAKRRLDVAKSNNSTNYTRIAELQGRVRAARKNEWAVKSIDRGAKLAAKGQTITGNRAKSALVFIGSKYAAAAIRPLLTQRLTTLQNKGKLTAGANYLADKIDTYGPIAIRALGYGYSAKKTSDSRNLRAYNKASWNGTATIKNIGSEEYADRVKRSK